MKKLLSAIMAATMCLGFSLPAFAATADQTTTENLGTDFTFTVQNDPIYTVTIPSAVTIAQDGTTVDITAENVANLGGKEIAVTIAGTNYYRNQMVLEGKDNQGINKVLRYQIITEDGTTVETTGKDTATGTELASFTDNGTVNYVVKPVVAPTTAKGVTYTGSMTYGIALTDAE
ncbi:MAG: hypothetical protein U0M15_04975 [Bacillota bacterium]|nr:hypothetical protein [Bacillota bacterium]